MVEGKHQMTEDEAAVALQKVAKGRNARKSFDKKQGIGQVQVRRGTATRAMLWRGGYYSAGDAQRVALIESRSPGSTKPH